MLTAGVFLDLTCAAGAAVHILRSYLRLRGAGALTCPENGRVVGVELDARHAAFTSRLRLQNCTRWPEKRDCGQECLSRISAAPQDCLLRNILARWYRGKMCAYCGNPFGAIDWIHNKPALMTPEGTTIEWSQVTAERAYEVLLNHKPVCWTCHVTNTFVHTHPELVVDRSGRP